MSLGEAELLLLLSCNSWGGGGGLICSASIEVAEAVAVLLQILSNVKDNRGKFSIENSFFEPVQLVFEGSKFILDLKKEN